MVDDEKKEFYKDKIESGEFEEDDIHDYLTFFTEMCNESDDVKEETDRWNRRSQFRLEGIEDAWFVVNDNEFSYGKGDIEGDPDITLEMSSYIAKGIFTGEVDAKAAYMAGDLKLVGNLPDAVRFRDLIEIVRGLL